MRFQRITLISILGILICIGSSYDNQSYADLDDILVSPKTLIDRVIEARSSSDIIEDNNIILKVNNIMLQLETNKASTEIYEQRLLVTALFNDKYTHDSFKNKVKQISTLKKLYWHADYSSNENRDNANHRLLDWTEVLSLSTKIKFNLIRTEGIADVNFRVAVDMNGTVFIIGRARSEKELNRVLNVANSLESVKKIIHYIEVRP